jgi:hypothetical protein
MVVLVTAYRAPIEERFRLRVTPVRRSARYRYPHFVNLIGMNVRGAHVFVERMEDIAAIAMGRVAGTIELRLRGGHAAVMRIGDIADPCLRALARTLCESPSSPAAMLLVEHSEPTAEAE